MKDNTVTTPIKRKRKPIRGEVKFLMFMGFLVIVAWTYTVGMFFSRYHLQTPVIMQFQAPYAKNELISPKGDESMLLPSVRPAKAIELTPAEKEAKVQEELEWLYDQTRKAESSYGKDKTVGATHNYCISIGKVNEIGYFKGGNKKYCFENEQAQHDEFMAWMNRRMGEGMTVQESMCLYVTGHKQPTCARVNTLNLGGL